MDELELQTREALDGKPITQNIFPFQVRVCRYVSWRIWQASLYTLLTLTLVQLQVWMCRC